MNVFALVSAALLAVSPYISRGTILNQMLGLNMGPIIEGAYKNVLHGLGGAALVIAAYYLYIRRRSGIIYIIMGVICLVTGYFHNDEKFQVVPVAHLLFGGGEFLAFIASALLVLVGLVQEFLLGAD